MTMASSQYSSAPLLIPHLAASKVVIQVKFTSTVVSSATLKSKNTQISLIAVSTFLHYNLDFTKACVKFEGYSKGGVVMDFNSCDLRKYEKQMKVKSYFLEKLLELNGDNLSEEEQENRNQ
jgi:hypothetical protein